MSDWQREVDAKMCGGMWRRSLHLVYSVVESAMGLDKRMIEKAMVDDGISARMDDAEKWDRYK